MRRHEIKDEDWERTRRSLPVYARQHFPESVLGASAPDAARSQTQAAQTDRSDIREVAARVDEHCP